MGSQEKSVLKPLEEVCIDMSSKIMEIDKTYQNGCKPISFEDNQRITDLSKTKEVLVEGGLEGTAIDQASQDGHKSTLFEVYLRIANQSEAKEIHVDVSSKGIVTDKASQDGHEPIEVKPTPEVNKDRRALFIAAQKGDWKTVAKMLNQNGDPITAEIIKVEKEPFTVLDVAIIASQDELVKNLIERFRKGREKFDAGSCLEKAARRGRIKMVKALLNKIGDETESISNALWIASRCAPKQKKVIWYLATRTKSAPVNNTMSNLIMAGHSDVALYLAQRFQDSVLHAETDSILEYLAKMESNFCSGARLNFWEKLFDKCILLCLINTSYDETPAPALKWFKISLWNLATKPGAALLINRTVLRHKCSLELAKLVLTKMESQMEIPKILELLSPIVLEAASRGISEIVKLSFEHFPELTWNENFAKRIVQEVVSGRHVDLFRLLNAPSTIPFLTDDTMRKDILMKAVVEWSPRCLPKDVFGAPFVMQRELQWFQVLEDTSDPSSKILKFKKVLQDAIDPALKSQGLYWDDFVEKRKQLLQEAGQWMKDTSSSCTVVSTLILTIAFAALFTVPGGNNSDTGIPIFLHKSSFMVFTVADALALSSSVTATLMFLAILTSRYAAEDFLMSLPRKMILGLTFLFLSLAFMLVSFGSALAIVLRERFLMSERLGWIYLPITSSATILVVLFAILQLPLYFEMLESTYWPRLYSPLKLWK